MVESGRGDKPRTGGAALPKRGPPQEGASHRASAGGNRGKPFYCRRRLVRLAWWSHGPSSPDCPADRRGRCLAGGSPGPVARRVDRRARAHPVATADVLGNDPLAPTQKTVAETTGQCRAVKFTQEESNGPIPDVGLQIDPDHCVPTVVDYLVELIWPWLASLPVIARTTSDGAIHLPQSPDTVADLD